jgi:hypothetical protein
LKKQTRDNIDIQKNDELHSMIFGLTNFPNFSNESSDASALLPIAGSSSALVSLLFSMKFSDAENRAKV